MNTIIITLFSLILKAKGAKLIVSAPFVYHLNLKNCYPDAFKVLSSLLKFLSNASLESFG